MEVEFDHGSWTLSEVKQGARCLPKGLRGTCDDVTLPEGKRKIYVAKGLKGREKLEVYLHELAHAAFPQACESAIDDFAVVVSAVLHKKGWKCP